MDGGGRLLGSLIEAGQSLFGVSRPRLAGIPDDFDPVPIVLRPPTRRSVLVHGLTLSRLKPAPGRNGLGLALTVGLFAITGLYGAICGGEYQTFVEANGSPVDQVAKALGFPIRAITVSGIKELDAREILDAAGIGPKNSLVVLNAAAIREKLKALPLVKDAVITKLFPDRLMITIDERNPRAIWQVDGKLSIISGDGVVIDAVKDDRFNGLPFVTGEGANTRVHEFEQLLEAAGDLRAHITAGVLVGQRRWSLKMDDGVLVDLPEIGPIPAITRLAALERDAQILEKDVISIDLRMPNRVTVRLSEDAASARAAMLARKTKVKGTPE